MAKLDVALALSAVAILFAALALWRVGRLRTLDLRQQLRRDVAELRTTMDALTGDIARALLSRTNLTAALGDTGLLESLRKEAHGDSIQLDALRGRLNEVNVVAPLTSQRKLEAKGACVQAIRARVHQLAEKYQAVARQDQQLRARSPEDSVAQASGRG